MTVHRNDCIAKMKKVYLAAIAGMYTHNLPYITFIIILVTYDT